MGLGEFSALSVTIGPSMDELSKGSLGDRRVADVASSNAGETGGVGAVFCVAMAKVRQEGGARPGFHQRGQPLLGDGQSQGYISSPNLPYSTQISLL